MATAHSDGPRGRLITVEGVEGAGKSTQVEGLRAWLVGRGVPAVRTAEPDGTPLGARLRQVLGDVDRVTPVTEALLFAAARAEHVQRVIRPALAGGQVVVCDRYVDSTVAYQGARGLDPALLLKQSEAEFPMPDLVLLLEIAVDAALTRVHARGGRIEGAFEARERLERVAAIFAGLERPYITRIDASADPERVAEKIAAALRERLGLP